MTQAAEANASIDRRAEQLFREHQHRIYARTDRLFAALMIGQWLFAIIVALTLSPYSWSGKTRAVHAHVYVAVILGGILSSLPVALALLQPGRSINRFVIAVAQMCWSALLIHLSGGRIETHFHVFGSLAFLAFYRDWRVLIPATVVVAADHLVRQIFWPESVYGILNPEWWRFIEHAFWVVFEDTVLIMACLVWVEEMREIARARAALAESEEAKTASLTRALGDLEKSHQTLLRTEKLAAVGQLAASVGHELRNPLAAVRNANSFLVRRLASTEVGKDARVQQFLELTERELGVCSHIISDLLDFARERPLAPAPCPLRALVSEAIGLVPVAGHARVVNEVPEDLPVPNLDRDQFRQILVNLIQNAVEAIPADRGGTVVVGGERKDQGLELTVKDDGAGMPREIQEKIFEPLFTTKSKGTGLGLAIVAGVLRRHGATVSLTSEPDVGTTFTIELGRAATEVQRVA